MYKKIASVRSRDDEDEIIDELMDRFGDVPQQTINLIKISHIRYLAALMSITEIKQNDNKVMLIFDEKNPLSGFGLAGATEAFGRRLFIHGGRQPLIRLTLGPARNGNLDDTLKLLEILAENRKTARKLEN